MTTAQAVNPTIVWGADPEVFATYQKDGKLFALPPVIFRRDLGVHATKDPKHPVFFKTKEWMAHEDGAAFEVAIRPSTDWRDVYERIHLAYSAIETRILQPFSEQGVCDSQLSIIPTVGWEIDRWLNEDASFFMSTRFGCDPDEDAFDAVAQCHVDDASSHPNRYGGGHIHASGFPGIDENPLMLVHAMAFSAGLAGVVYSNQHDSDRDRVFRYGRPGKFRVQRYGKLFNDLPNTDIGIEYRTLSNAWTSDVAIAEKVFEHARFGITELFLRGGMEKVWHLNGDVQKAIIEHDPALASELLNTIETSL